MEAWVIAVIVVAIIIVLFPAAFVWFLNISGLLTVWKESRAREKRRVKARKEALARVAK